MSSKYLLNYKFREKDDRDYVYQSRLTAPILKSVTIASTNTIPIFDQGSLGSCVANAFIQCINIMTKKTVMGSRLYLYFNGRAVAKYPLELDDGLSVRDGCKSIAKYGLCDENIWPYNVSLFADLPSLQAYQKSLLFKSFVYSFVNQDINSIKNCLNTTKNPIIFGINIYSSFLSVGSNGIIPLPNVKTETVEGGHCMIMIGYDDSNQWVICVNSWGTEWGNKGICYLPYSYLLNPDLSSDFCTLSFNYSTLPKTQQFKVQLKSKKPQMSNLTKMKYTSL
jgi:C1A family cysteine protease